MSILNQLNIADRIAKLNSAILRKNKQLLDLSQKCNSQTEEIANLKKELKEAREALKVKPPARKPRTRKTRATTTRKAETKDADTK